MGIIRKTASISTLGLISFRSKKERLRRAEAAHRSASDELAVEQTARADADRRVAEAERRAHQAELAALHEAKVAQRRGRKADRAKAGKKADHGRRARRKAAKRARHAEATVRESVSGLVSAAQPVLEAGARGARKHGRAARKRAGQAAAQMTPRVEDAANKAKDLATDLAARARDSIDV